MCVGTLDLAAVHTVTQHVEIIAEEDKRQRVSSIPSLVSIKVHCRIISKQLLDFIKSLEEEDKAIIFVGRKQVADQLASDLSLSGIICQCIHGDREQADREQV